MNEMNDMANFEISKVHFSKINFMVILVKNLTYVLNFE